MNAVLNAIRKANLQTTAAHRAPGRSRAQEIAAQLGSEIINGTRRPGERLVELELAAKFGVSRVPVREALLLLEGEGLVRQGSRGVQVAEITIEEMSDTFQVLACLEDELTRSAAAHVTADDIGHMEKIVRRMDTAARRRDISDYFDCNLEFHSVIQNRCPNRKLVALMGSLGKQTIRYRRLAMSLPGRLAVSIDEHREILAHLKNEDGSKAGKAARTSAENAAQGLFDLLAHNPNLL